MIVRCFKPVCCLCSFLLNPKPWLNQITPSFFMFSVTNSSTPPISILHIDSKKLLRTLTHVKLHKVRQKKFNTHNTFFQSLEIKITPIGYSSSKTKDKNEQAMDVCTRYPSIYFTEKYIARRSKPVSHLFKNQLSKCTFSDNCFVSEESWFWIICLKYEMINHAYKW